MECINLDTSMKYFLMVAEELNISKVAQKAFVSHQSISSHIKHLEKKYNVKLFYRKPNLSLTPAGQKMVNIIQQIQILEKNISSELKVLDDKTTGTIRLGIATPRAKVLLPTVLLAFRKDYPNIKIVTSNTITINSEKHVLDDELDLFVGLSPIESSNFITETLFFDRLHIIISDNMLKKYFPDNFPECKTSFKKGINLREFSHLPFINVEKESKLRILIEKYLREQSISINFVFETADMEFYTVLSKQDFAVSFCPQMTLDVALKINRAYSNFSNLNAFPISDNQLTSEVVLAYHKYHYFPAYIRKFIHLIKKSAFLLSRNFAEI